MTDKRVCAVILARGGSKSVKRKNMQLLSGKPLVHYPILAAHESRLVCDDDVFVSTDDAEIAQYAQQSGAHVIERPASISGDFALDVQAMRHFLKLHPDYDVVIHLRATFPAITGEIVDRALTDFIGSYDMYDSLRSVVRAKESPYKMWALEYSNGPTRIVPAFRFEQAQESHSAPRQLLPAFYWQNAAIDIVKSWVVTELNSMTGDRVLPFFMESKQRIDIDDECDLENARAAMKGEA